MPRARHPIPPTPTLPGVATTPYPASGPGSPGGNGAKLRAALYSRVSTKDKGQTTENQTPVLRAFAVELGYDVALVFEDQDHGDTASREQLSLMTAAAKRREFDVLIFWSLDRFSREGSFRTLERLQHLNDWGVRWRSYTEQFLDTCGVFREAIIAMLAALAKQEQIRLRERVRAGVLRAKASGKIVGRPPIDIDLERFRRMDAVYTTGELIDLLQISRTVVYNLRARLRLADSEKEQNDSGS